MGQTHNILGGLEMAAPVEGSLPGFADSLGLEDQDEWSIADSYEGAGETLKTPTRPRNLSGL